MTGKTCEVRYKTTLQHREELKRIAREVLGLNLQQAGFSIMELGMQEIRKALIEGNTIKIEHLPNSSTQRIFFEGKEK